MSQALRSEAKASAVDGVEEFKRAVAAAQADIDMSIERAGLRNDPYAYALKALSNALGLFPGFVRAQGEAAERGRLPFDAAALSRMEKVIAAGAAKSTAQLVRAQMMRNTLLAAAVLAGSVLLTGTVIGVSCYRWGRGSAVAEIQETGAGFAAAFRDGPDAATNWLRLMRLNDLPRVLAACAGNRAFTDPATGRRACMAPLWLDPQPLPATQPR